MLLFGFFNLFLLFRFYTCSIPLKSYHLRLHYLCLLRQMYKTGLELTFCPHFIPVKCLWIGSLLFPMLEDSAPSEGVRNCSFFPGMYVKRGSATSNALSVVSSVLLGATHSAISGILLGQFKDVIWKIPPERCLFPVDKVVKPQFIANVEFNVEFSNTFTRGGIELCRKLDLFCYCTVTVIPWKHWNGWLQSVWNDRSNVTLFIQV